MNDIATLTGAPLLSSDTRALIEEIKGLDLPNMTEVVMTGARIEAGQLQTQRPLGVRLPLPGRYTQRKGKRLSAVELFPLVDGWVNRTAGATRFVIQGGNRYISDYLKNQDTDALDIKVMSVSKAPLYTQLSTVLSPAERQEVLPDFLSSKLGLPAGITREAALVQLADYVPASPFSAITNDQTLEDDLEKTVDILKSGSVSLDNKDALRAILNDTDISRKIRSGRELAFIDDLFYRGRTLYSLAVIVDVCGGDMGRIKLTTVACDQKSVNLKSPYHEVLASHVLYPFENSIRTEQGYWQDVGTKYIFTDMGLYWEYLRDHARIEESEAVYGDWRAMLTGWADKYLSSASDDLDYSLILPLLWLSIYAEMFGLDLSFEKIIDQKGYKIGASVPFAQLIDRFISQEEPVEARLGFKSSVMNALMSIRRAMGERPAETKTLVDFYTHHRRDIDYRGLDFMFEQPGGEHDS